jgi:hypothetical protein
VGTFARRQTFKGSNAQIFTIAAITIFLSGAFKSQLQSQNEDQQPLRTTSQLLSIAQFEGARSCAAASHVLEMFFYNVGRRNTHVIEEALATCFVDWWWWSNLRKCMPFRQHAPPLRKVEICAQNRFFSWWN